MNKFAALAVVAATALMATAAAAQPYSYARSSDWEPINQRQMRMERHIERGVMRGTLTASEARRLHMQMRQIAHVEARYRINGLSRAERAELDRRFDQVATAIRFESRDRDYGYGYGYGYSRR